MITIDEFKLIDDLASISVQVTSDSTAVDYIKIYVGDNYLTDTYYNVPMISGQLTYTVTVYASQLGETAPLTDIYILETGNVSNETNNGGIWSLEAPSQCLANLVLNYETDCKNCKGITDINIMYMNIESTTMFLALKDFEKALETLDTVKLMCPDYGAFTIPADTPCPGGIGCWIIENDFIVQ